MKNSWQRLGLRGMALLFSACALVACISQNDNASEITNTNSSPSSLRQRIALNDDWKFYRYEDEDEADDLIYDVRPEITVFNDAKDADSKPTDAVEVTSEQRVLKPWIMPTGNAFIADSSKHYTRPEGEPGSNFPFVSASFDDSDWKSVTLPHDWGIEGPFYEGDDPKVGGGMGRLPSHGVAWYRKSLTLSDDDEGKQIFLDIDGAMSYAMVWLNGHLVGGWPYGYSSWRVNLTPYVNIDGNNQLAIRLDNPQKSSRWYPGGGLYRHVWLVKTGDIHVRQWGTKVVTSEVSAKQATLDVTVAVNNESAKAGELIIENAVHLLNEQDEVSDSAVVYFPDKSLKVSARGQGEIKTQVTLKHPRLWGPKPSQTPHRYALITRVLKDGEPIDVYQTEFGVRDIVFDPNRGVVINGEVVKLQGVNQHHDLGALGAAFNERAAQRQLELLQEMGANAVRLAHNPPAPELLTLMDKMGILALDESFDVWYKKKTPLDFHLIFDDWHEQDLRSVVRRDRNHPSVIMWYIGNEVGEQYTDEEGADVVKALREIVHDEDGTRPVTASMNWAKAEMPFPRELDLISLNYQGEGIRQAPEFEGTDRIRTPPSYPAFKAAHPDKVVLSSESASAFSSRGIYLFPVSDAFSAPVRDGRGGDDKIHQVSAYELHAVDFGASADKVFKYMDMYPWVAGQFVWTGWDYIGEPTPYYSSRSSYSGIIDLAGFKKDRFWLYQSEWRPEKPMVHILPHWSWPERKGKVTPVHVFTSGDEVELFVNGKSQGRKKKAEYTYRLRFDDVIYAPGSVTAVAYRDGVEWARETIETAGEPAALRLSADRAQLEASGDDLAFITIDVVDSKGRLVPYATDEISISVKGAGELVATDNGDPTDFTPFQSATREAFSGKMLGIVRTQGRVVGDIKISAHAKGLKAGGITLTSH